MEGNGVSPAKSRLNELANVYGKHKPHRKGRSKRKGARNHHASEGEFTGGQRMVPREFLAENSHPDEDALQMVAHNKGRVESKVEEFELSDNL